MRKHVILPLLQQKQISPWLREDKGVSDTDLESDEKPTGNSTPVVFKDQADFLFGPEQDQKGLTTRVKMKKRPWLTNAPEKDIHSSHKDI